MNKKRIIDQRITSNPTLFKASWATTDEHREWIFQTYKNKFRSMEWNDEWSLIKKKGETDFIPVVHMTTFPIAKLICQTGRSSQV